MSAEIQQTRYDRTIRRVGGIIGPGSKVSEVLSELFPVIDLENLPGELLALGGTALAEGSILVAPLAANFSRAQLHNPENSGKIITLTHVWVSTAVADIMRWGTQEAPITTLVTTAAVRDTRLGIGSLPAGQMRQATAGFASPGTGRVDLGVDAVFTLEDDNGIAVLGPNAGWEIGSTTANVGILVTFFWRERSAQQSELSL